MNEIRGFRLTWEMEGLPQGHVRVQMKGNFIWPSTKSFTGDVSHLIANGTRHLQTDLAEMTYLDSTGLSAFVAVHKALQEVGGALSISNPRRLIRHLFVSAKLDGVLDVGPSIDG